MPECTHHWRQGTESIHAPFVCVRCGESRQMETDYYRMRDAQAEAKGGRRFVADDYPLAVA
jgi:hypothetical protein